jgi:excisionase family DNA binding protein
LSFGTPYAIKLNQTWKKGDAMTALMDKDIVLTTQEAIQYLKISKPTYLRYIRLGRIRAVKAGSGWRVHQSELYRFLRVGRSLEMEVQ